MLELYQVLESYQIFKTFKKSESYNIFKSHSALVIASIDQFDLVLFPFHFCAATSNYSLFMLIPDGLGILGNIFVKTIISVGSKD